MAGPPPSQSHGYSFDLSLASKSYLKVAKKLYVKVPGGVPQPQKTVTLNSFLQSHGRSEKQNEENKNMNMSECTNIIYITTTGAKVFNQDFLFAAE